MIDQKFGADLEVLVSRLVPERSGQVFSQLETVRMKLVDMHTKNSVKINHSAMEVVCANDLISKGYEVDVEHTLDSFLVCDLFGVKGDGKAVVEIETGFVPPEHALDSASYYSARIASKIARYSVFADKFSLASPPYQILLIPSLFLKPPRSRGLEEVEETKKLCDHYYESPPITLEEISTARLHSVLSVNVDSGSVREFDPQTYAEHMRTCLDAVKNPLLNSRSGCGFPSTEEA
jgi:hypothetical protein